MAFHYGGPNGVHYTAKVLKKDIGKWYTCDDSSYSEMDEKFDQGVMRTRHAYVLFYKRLFIDDPNQQYQPKFDYMDNYLKTTMHKTALQ